MLCYGRIIWDKLKKQQQLEKLKDDFEVPEILKYNPEKENKPITEENILFEYEGCKDVFTPVLGIVSSPTRTNSVKLKKERWNRK